MEPLPQTKDFCLTEKQSGSRPYPKTEGRRYGDHKPSVEYLECMEMGAGCREYLSTFHTFSTL